MYAIKLTTIGRIRNGIWLQRKFSVTDALGDKIMYW